MSLIDPLDINGNPCDGYSSIWPCTQWIPLPYSGIFSGTSAPPQLTAQDVSSTVDIIPVTPVTITPEPAYNVLFGAFLAVLLGRSVWRAARKYTTRESDGC